MGNAGLLSFSSAWSSNAEWFRRIVVGADVPAGSASFPLRGVPTYGRHLHMRYMSRATSSSITSGILLQINGDTTAANYIAQLLGLGADAGDAISVTQNTTSAGLYIGRESGTTGLANVPGLYETILFDYTNRLTGKVALCQGMYSFGSSLASNINVADVWSVWFGTGGVQRLDIAVDGGTGFANGSIFDFYVEH